MGYLHKFSNLTDFNNYYNGDSYNEPFVSATLTEGEPIVNYNKTEDEKERPKMLENPLTLEILSDGNVVWKSPTISYTKSFEFKKNDDEWSAVTTITSLTINVLRGDIIQFRGTNVTANRFGCFGDTTCRFNAKYNIMSLIDKTNYKNLTVIGDESAFSGLFSGCTGLVNAKYLALPATTLTSYSYSSMFSGCTSLVTAPELPATNLNVNNRGCYQYMFGGCTSLVTAPELPATAICSDCYECMFQNCTSLVNGPSTLPATAATHYCYNSMFEGCTSLINVPSILPATDFTGYAMGCYANMFSGCKSLVTAPALPATNLGDTELTYANMFAGCTSLVTAPALPVTGGCWVDCFANMFSGCTNLETAPVLYKLEGWKYEDGWGIEVEHYPMYNNMFQGCTKLNYIKCLNTETSSGAYSDWLDGVSPTGTFVKDSSANWSTGINGIPSGWTVVSE